jgi:hypothetical protein
MTYEMNQKLLANRDESGENGPETWVNLEDMPNLLEWLKDKTDAHNGEIIISDVMNQKVVKKLYPLGGDACPCDYSMRPNIYGVYSLEKFNGCDVVVDPSTTEHFLLVFGTNIRQAQMACNFGKKLSKAAGSQVKAPGVYTVGTILSTKFTTIYGEKDTKQTPVDSGGSICEICRNRKRAEGVIGMGNSIDGDSIGVSEYYPAEDTNWNTGDLYKIVSQKEIWPYLEERTRCLEIRESDYCATREHVNEIERRETDRLFAEANKKNAPLIYDYCPSRIPLRGEWPERHASGQVERREDE